MSGQGSFTFARDLPPRRLSEASQENWTRICPTLSEREYAVLMALYSYLEMSGYPDCTGGELAAFSGIPILSVRPRLSGLLDKKLIETLEIRYSRAAGEQRCNPARPTLPRRAVERAQQEQK